MIYLISEKDFERVVNKDVGFYQIFIPEFKQLPGYREIQYPEYASFFEIPEIGVFLYDFILQSIFVPKSNSVPITKNIILGEKISMENWEVYCDPDPKYNYTLNTFKRSSVYYVYGEEIPIINTGAYVLKNKISGFCIEFSAKCYNSSGYNNYTTYISFPEKLERKLNKAKCVQKECFIKNILLSWKKMK